MENIISVTNLSKQFKKTVVLNDISVDFEKGKIHGIVGRNGSGKTLLFKCICGLIHYSSGSIKVNDKIIGKDVDIPDSIGMIIESPGFLPGYSAYNNLKFLSEIGNRVSKEKIISTIELVGLDPESKKHVGKYSLGMRQRLGIAQAIMEEPDILVLDEPMNGLDNHGVEDIRTLLSGLREQGKTILIASHNREDIDILCDTVHEMDHGVITPIK